MSEWWSDVRVAVWCQSGGLMSEWQSHVTQGMRATAEMEIEKLWVFLCFWVVLRYSKLFWVISKYSLGRLFKKNIFLYGLLMGYSARIEILTLLPLYAYNLARNY